MKGKKMSDNLNKKVLVVDDEEDVRNYLQTALEDAGFTVFTAIDGLDALEKVQSMKPDLVSLDLVMPKHSGVKFHYEMKKNKELSKIPILIVTGHAHDDLGKPDLDKLTMQGIGVYLEKPVKPNKYVSTICGMLGVQVPDGFQFESDENTDSLREEVAKSLSQADPEDLKKALELLKKK